MFLDVILLLSGLALIIKGGDWFVAASVRIAELLQIPRVVIGSTLVSLTTTSPELVVSLVAGFENESGLAVGNAVGSCICNMALILGLVAAVKHIVVHPRSLRTPIIAMLTSGFLLLILTLDLVLARWQGAMLLTLGVGYFIFDFFQHQQRPKPAEIREAKAIEADAVGGHPRLKTAKGAACQFLIGAAVVILGSKMLVDSAVALAAGLGIPSIIIGLSVVAVGTSLPELVTAITSSRKNVSDLAIGNVLGANVANLTLVVGSAASINEVSMTRITQLYNFPAMLILMALLVFFLVSKKGLSRKNGMVLLCFYAVYISGLIILMLLKKT